MGVLMILKRVLFPHREHIRYKQYKFRKIENKSLEIIKP